MFIYLFAYACLAYIGTSAGLSGARGNVVEVAPGFEGGPGFQPPQERIILPSGQIRLGPLGVAVMLE